MSLPAREAPPSADASLPLRFDDSDRDLLARAFGSPGDGPRAWRLNGEAHRISLVDGFDRLLAWPVLRAREARAPSACGPGPAVGSHRRGRGASTQEPLQPELAFRRRALEEVHAPPDRDPGPERHGRALQPRHPPETRPVAHARSVPRAVRCEPGPAGADAGGGGARGPPGRGGAQTPRHPVHASPPPRAHPRRPPTPPGPAA